MDKYEIAIDLQEKKGKLVEHLQNAESPEETHRLLSLMENINQRISNALY
ncbi:MAG: hypothetical protein PF569_04750 [Candidatus Woesearchaeota archaeon]|jgi:hypothetical protein|nr:hypothetical protein [Candidatus Woesearchaeota archaeon]